MKIARALTGHTVRHRDTGKTGTVLMGTQYGRILVKIHNSKDPYKEKWERYCTEIISTNGVK